MTRKGFFQTIAAAVAAPKIAVSASPALPPAIGALATPEDLEGREEYFGRFNYREDVFEPGTIIYSKGGIVLLNGRKVSGVFHACTRTGIIKTYWVLPDQGRIVANWVYQPGKPNQPRFCSHDFPGREVSCPLDDVVVETLRGKVRIFGPKR